MDPHLAQHFRAFREMKVSETLSSSTFEECTRLLQDVTLLRVTRELVTEIYRQHTHTIPSRQLLSSYVIAFFPQEALASQRNELENRVYDQARAMILQLEHPEPAITAFIEAYTLYSTLFTEWKQHDEVDLQRILHTVKTNLEGAEPSSEVKQTLEKLDRIAESVWPDGVHPNENTTPIIDPTAVGMQVAQTMHTAFWDRFAGQLQADPPEFTQYPSLVREIRTRIEQLLPNTKREVVLKWVRNNLDEEEISRQILQKTYSLQDIYNLCVFCLERVKDLGAAVDDASVNAILERVHLEMEKPSPVVHEIIPNVVKFCLERLDQIIFIKETFFEASGDTKPDEPPGPPGPPGPLPSI